MTPSSSSSRGCALKSSTLASINGYFKGAEAKAKADSLTVIITEIVGRVLEALTKTDDVAIQEEELQGAIEFKKGCRLIVQDIKERDINVEGEVKWEDESKLQSQPHQVCNIHKIT